MKVKKNQHFHSELIHFNLIVKRKISLDFTIKGQKTGGRLYSEYLQNKYVSGRISSEHPLDVVRERRFGFLSRPMTRLYIR